MTELTLEQTQEIIHFKDEAARISKKFKVIDRRMKSF